MNTADPARVFVSGPTQQVVSRGEHTAEVTVTSIRPGPRPENGIESSAEVAGAAALVWAANPDLGAAGVAEILKQSASGHGGWNQDTGFGNLDVAAAVARAQGTSVAVPTYSAVKLDLRASPSARKKMRLSAVFAATSRTVARAGRRLALESFYGHSWHRFAARSIRRR